MTVSLYALCDCASTPEAYADIVRLESHDARCLFEGALSEPLRRASPFIARLTEGDALTRRCLQSPARQTVTLVRSTCDLARVRRRFRRHMQARLPNGTGPLLFRVWDPRVIAAYVPTLSAREIADWRSDLDGIFVHDEGGGWREIGIAPPSSEAHRR